MILNCEQCGANMSDEQINTSTGFATCTYCGATTVIDEDIVSRSDWSSQASRFDVPMPSGFSVEPADGKLRIRRSWFRPAILFMALFTLVWNGFMVVWFSMAMRSGAGFMAMFGLLHAGVGMFLLYTTAAAFINTTTITVGMSRLSVLHGPMPWPGSKTLATPDIAQLYTRKKIKTGKDSVKITYEVHVIGKDSRRIELIKGLDSEDDALFIEQEVEKYLGIKDQPVRGELPR